MFKIVLVVAAFVSAHFMLQSYENWIINFGIVLMAVGGGLLAVVVNDYFFKESA